MTKPLALIFYENLLTGNQLLNRLSDLDYRTLAVSDLGKLPAQAAAETPIVLIVELGALAERVCGIIRSLRAAPATEHIPIIAYVQPKGRKEDAKLTEQAQTAGAKLVVGEALVLPHLAQLLDQALRLD